jgi:multiple sugar transport system permease protein
MSEGLKAEGWKNIYVFILPLLLFMLGMIFLPVVGTFWTSLFRDVGFLPRRFLGLANYKKLLGDPYFWQSARFTLLFALVSVALEMVLGTIFALLLNEKLPLRGLFRASILIPWAIPVAISARIWELIYSYNYGLANFLLLKTGICSRPINWLGSSAGAFFSLLLADIWKTTPFVTIILLAGLQAIPEELYEQAKVDGTNFYQRFLKITLPLLKPIFLVAILFRTIDALRIFDLVYVLTHGGPGGATTSLSLYGYKFFLTSDFGYGSAVSVVCFLIAFTLSILYLRMGRFGRS